MRPGTARLKSPHAAVGAVAFTPDGKTSAVLLSVRGESSVYRLDLSGPTPKETEAIIKGKAATFARLLSAPTEKCADAGPDAGAVLWDAVTGKRLKQWSPAETIGSAAFSTDSRHISLTLATGPVYVLRLGPPN
jgi:hypothetical protein